MTEFGRVYGDGLYDLCAEEKLDAEILGQLCALKEIFHRQGDFFRLLSNMSLSKQERCGIVDHALRGQVHPYVLNFLKLLVERGAVSSYDDCLKAYQERYDQAHRAAEATVTTAKPLNEIQRARLIEKLTQMTGREIRLKEQTDASLLGGVLLEMEGKRYDNTVRHRLRAIEQAMSGEA